MTEREQAADHLRVIRSLMERATVYRTISWPTALFGGTLVLVLAVLLFFRERAAIRGGRLEVEYMSEEAWVACWMVALVVTAAFNAVLIARKSKLGIHAYRSESEAELERDENGIFRFKHILIRPRLRVDPDAGRLAHKVVQKAHRLCLVANSLRCPVEIEVGIEH
jgi:hypothetical protein